MSNETIEKIIDNLFLEPYGLDDCMEIMRMLYNSAFDFNKIVEAHKSKDDEETGSKEEIVNKIRKKIKHERTFNIYLSSKGTYLGHYRIHSENAFDVLHYLSDKSKQDERTYLESKVVNFFKSYEWETWGYRNAESEGAIFK